MIPSDTLDQIRARFEFLEAKMASGGDAQDFAALSREYSELRPVVAEIDAYREMIAAEADAKALLDDPEMADLAEEELEGLRQRLPEAEQALRVALLPKDAADARPAIVEMLNA